MHKIRTHASQNSLELATACQCPRTNVLHFDLVRVSASVRVCRDKPARCEGVQVSDSEGLANHAGSESCASLGNGVREALTGERAGRVWSPEMANLGADALLTRGRQQRARHYGKAYTHLAGSKTPGMHGNMVCGTREARRLALSIAARPAW